PVPDPLRGHAVDRLGAEMDPARRADRDRIARAQRHTGIRPDLTGLDEDRIDARCRGRGRRGRQLRHEHQAHHERAGNDTHRRALVFGHTPHSVSSDMIAGPLESEVTRRERPNRKAARRPGHKQPPESGPRALTTPPPAAVEERGSPPPGTTWKTAASAGPRKRCLPVVMP